MCRRWKKPAGSKTAGPTTGCRQAHGRAGYCNGQRNPRNLAQHTGAKRIMRHVQAQQVEADGSDTMPNSMQASGSDTQRRSLVRPEVTPRIVREPKTHSPSSHVSLIMMLSGTKAERPARFGQQPLTAGLGEIANGL